MSRALVLLNWLRNIAGWRFFFQGRQGSAGALLGKILVLLFLLGSALGWLSAVGYGLMSDQNDPLKAWLRPAVREMAHVAPLPLLLFLLLSGILSMFERPFKFSPTEVDLLYAGPFRRGQLLNYKIGAALYNQVAISFLMAAPLGPSVSGVVPVFVGSVLLFSFFHLFALTTGSLGTLAGFHDERGRRRLAVTVGFFAVVPAILWFGFGSSDAGPIEVYREFARARGWRAATAPLRWFIETMLAERLWPDFAMWSSLCLLVNGILFMTVHRLDARVEAKAEANDRQAPEEEALPQVSNRVPWALPLRSRYRGVGPIAWRQCMNVARRPHEFGATLLMYGLTILMLFGLTIGSHSILFLPTLDGHRELNPVGARLCGAFAVMLPMLLASRLPFDFRGDVGRIDVLKALPIGPLAVTSGQLFVPIVIASVMQWSAIAAAAIALRSVPEGLWIAAAFVPPVSVVLMAIENLPTFWFPIRQTPGRTPEPFEMIGLVLLHPLLRLAGYCAALVMTFAVSVGVYFVFGQRLTPALIGAWITLAASGFGLIALLAHVFDRFDVTHEV